MKSFKGSVADDESPVAHLGKRRVVSHDNYRLAEALAKGEEQRVYFLLGRAVKVSGRLVREDEGFRNDGRRAACTPKYDMSKYNWDEIAKQVLEVYKSL
jgi:hypothetical protein